LGDGSVTPMDLIRGPPWLIGFRGNELQRLSRQLKFEGEKLAHLYPARYHNIKKRVFFLYKKYNQRRGKRVGGQ
jgi:large subunit ribosomal protein L51